MSIFQPYVLFLIYVVVQSAFILLIPMFQPSSDIVSGDIVYSTLVMILAVVISRMRYQNWVKVFENEKSIEEKNDELEKINTEFGKINEKLKKANEKLKHLSQRDGLTNIFNRSMFDKTINLEWNKCQRNQLPLSLLMIDSAFEFFQLVRRHSLSLVTYPSRSLHNFVPIALN